MVPNTCTHYYQRVSLSHVNPSDLDPRFNGESSRHKLVAIGDSSVGAVSNTEFHALSKDVQHIPNHPPHDKWIHDPRHLSRYSFTVAQQQGSARNLEEAVRGTGRCMVS